MQFYTLFGLIFLGFVVLKLIKKVGNELPILDIMFVIAGFQWILGPYIDYLTPTSNQKYYMYVTELEYMKIVVPLYIAFVTPYYILTYFRPIHFNLNIDNLGNIAITFILIGILSSLLGGFLPKSFSFFIYLLSNLFYVGAGIILIQKEKKNKMIAYLSILWLLYTSIKTGFFHNLFLWSVFLFFIWTLNKNIKKIYILLIFIVTIHSATIIQSVKNDFRIKLLTSNNPVELFLNLISDAFFNTTILPEEEKANEINVRLNQGWIISAIFYNVPKYEPFAEGKTIKEAVYSSILPRFLSQTKKEAGGRENFRKFTGLSIRDDTSMGISILGEAYANYGKIGGVLFMFLWGLVLVLYWYFLIQFQNNTPILLFLLPLIFLQVIKAESELVVVLNHLVKASIVSFGIIWIFRNNSRNNNSIIQQKVEN